MTTSVYMYFNVQRLDREAQRLGFVVGQKHDMLALFPSDDNLPIWARDTAVATSNTVEELLAFLWGWEKSRFYLRSLKITNDAKIKRAEQDYRNQILAEIIKRDSSELTSTTE